jgi:indolepyruvate ferredoxin oxidoreductase alpha subunit
VHGRPPSFCTGCPERPIFAAMKLVERELGHTIVSADIGCHLFSIFPPFKVGADDDGLRPGAAGASALNVKAGKRAISMMGDGGFWHNGLTSGRRQRRVQQERQRPHHRRQRLFGGDRRPGHPLLVPSKHRPLHTELDREGGARRRRELGQDHHRTYDVAKFRDTLREALTTKEKARRSSSRSRSAC